MYRVKEVNGKFVPQVGNWLFGYRSIDKVESSTWGAPENAKYCQWNTLEEALDRIRTYRPKYHKVNYHKVK